MSIDYGEAMIQAAEEIAVALKALTDEIRQLRRTHTYILDNLEELVRVQNNRP